MHEKDAWRGAPQHMRRRRRPISHEQSSPDERAGSSGGPVGEPAQSPGRLGRSRAGPTGSILSLNAPKGPHHSLQPQGPQPGQRAQGSPTAPHPCARWGACGGRAVRTGSLGCPTPSTGTRLHCPRHRGLPQRGRAGPQGRWRKPLFRQQTGL